MAAEALDNTLRPLSVARLRSVQRRQLGRNPQARFVLPRLVFHNLAGNLFISGWESLMLSALAGACSIVRMPAEDRHYARLWVEAMARANPAAAMANVCLWWPHEREDLTRTAAQAADAVVAFGSDEAVEAVRRLVPLRARFLGHGHKVSFALIDEDDLSATSPDVLAQRLAYDFSVYDQQGCLSPRGVFVRTRSAALLKQTGERLVLAMRRLAARLPLHELSLEEAAALARERQETLIQQAAVASATARQRCDPRAQVLSAPTDCFLVEIRSLAPFSLGPANRTVVLRGFRDGDELLEALLPYRGLVSTLGVVRLRPQWERLAQELVAGRICPVGRMQKPPLGWTHDGYEPLAALCSGIETCEMR
jgi:hypothetical protein